ncbi:MAG TPA: LLM class flavin-dependent oxidoreductase, partial [Caulobacteraceae bacterium]|nr:LLM class flavin-dependent oxidoreductase [Caulobacteraceae bacterium]
ETREKARENVQFGLKKWMAYFTDVAALPIAPQGGGDPVDALIETGLAVVGTPDDAIAQLERLETQSGGFGCFLQMAHDWADWAETKYSYELFARHVAPKFQALNGNREESYKVVGASHDATMGQARMAVGQRIVQHIQEKGTENVAPQILEALGLNKKPDAAE